MIEHFYQKIPGYFTGSDFYNWLSREFPDGHGVEVGSFMGRSAAYLAVEIINQGGKGRIDLVDTFVNGASARDVQQTLAPVRHVIGNIHTGLSWEGAALYGDRSLDWVYIDADHHYEPVCRDIDAWLPKVKPGGVIAGHDYSGYPGYGVIQAVAERFTKVEIWQGAIFNGDGVRTFESTEGFGLYYPSWCVRIPKTSGSTLHYYDRAFFDQMHAQRAETKRFAESIFEVVEGVTTAFDMGAGIGTQTLRLKELGWDITGGDFAPLALEEREPGVDIVAFDLTEPHGGSRLARVVDCVICTEVAEHIPAEHADSVIENVTSMATNWIVWSAAPPGQGGDGHINCQPPKYWLDKFRDRGWAPDEVRTALLRATMGRSRSLHHQYADNFYVLAPYL